jgi:hypothetical protein
MNALQQASPPEVLELEFLESVFEGLSVERQNFILKCLRSSEYAARKHGAAILLHAFLAREEDFLAHLDAVWTPPPQRAVRFARHISVRFARHA